MPPWVTLLRFALVGGAVAATYVFAYLLLLQAALPQQLANLLAFGLAVALQYIGQTLFTFERRLADTSQALRFVVMIGLGLLASALITGWVGPRLGLSNGIAALLVTLILPLQNFFLMSLWVYTKGPQQTEPLS